MSMSPKNSLLKKWLPFIMVFGGCFLCLILVFVGISIGKSLNKSEPKSKKVNTMPVAEHKTEATTEAITEEVVTEATTENVIETTTEAATEELIEDVAKKTDTEEWEKEIYDGLKFSHPSKWIAMAGSDTTHAFWLDKSGKYRFFIDINDSNETTNVTETMTEEQLKTLAIQLAASFAEDGRIEDYGVDDFLNNVGIWFVVIKDSNGISLQCHSNVFFANDKIYTIMVAYPEEEKENKYSEEINNVIDSIIIDNSKNDKSEIEVEKKSSSR